MPDIVRLPGVQASEVTRRLATGRLLTLVAVGNELHHRDAESAATYHVKIDFIHVRAHDEEAPANISHQVLLSYRVWKSIGIEAGAFILNGNGNAIGVDLKFDLHLFTRVFPIAVNNCVVDDFGNGDRNIGHKVVGESGGFQA